MNRLILAFILISSVSFGQDSLVSQDSVATHSIRKAVILSACAPGAGQIYNHLAMPKGQKKAFWKVPLIYAGLGTSTFFLIRNQIEQKNLKTEYTNRDKNPLYIPGTDFPEYSNYDDQGVLTLYNQYINWRDLSILAVGAIYFLQIVDAGVEAHFVSFDISEDLSFTFEPVFFRSCTRTEIIS
jgi:hypothetical protein